MHAEALWGQFFISHCFYYGMKDGKRNHDLVFSNCGITVRSLENTTEFLRALSDQPADLRQESNRWPADKRPLQLGKKGAVLALVITQQFLLLSLAIACFSIRSKASPLSARSCAYLYLGTGFKAFLIVIVSSGCPDTTTL